MLRSASETGVCRHAEESLSRGLSSTSSDGQKPLRLRQLVRCRDRIQAQCLRADPGRQRESEGKVCVIDYRYLLSLLLALFLFCGTAASADQHFSDEVFFDTSLAPDAYHYSSGQASGDSRIALVDGKLPVTTAHFISGPNALRLAWTSAKGGNWSAEINSYRWRNRPARWAGTTLYAWAWSDEPIAAGDLPQLALVDALKKDWSNLSSSSCISAWTKSHS